MARSKHKLCLGCNQPFVGRVDARTCSARCRKRFQRSKILYRDVLLADEHQIDYTRPEYAKSGELRGQYAG